MNNQPIVSKIDNYIVHFEPEIRVHLEEIRAAVSKIVPDPEEAIRYQIPTFRWKNKNLIHFAAYKKHIGFYPGPKAIATFEKDISIYKTSKGAIQFPLDQPMPLELIERITKFAVSEVAGNDETIF